jgi:hypothetical protein
MLHIPEVTTMRRFLPFAFTAFILIAAALPGQASTARPARSLAASPTSDFNGDGVGDQAIGVPDEDVAFGGGSVAGAGAVSVLYGQSSGGLQATSPDDLRLTQAGPILGDPEAGDHFGTAVATGDFDGDGFADLAVGVPGEDAVDDQGNPHPDAGKINVVYGSATGLNTADNQLWSQVGNALKGDIGDDEAFGSSLASADFNGDGFADLAIGIPHDGVGSVSDAGSVSVMYGSAGGLQPDAPDDQLWNQDAADVEGTPAGGDRFGAAIVGGDFNADGFGDLAIGAPHDTVGSATGGGAVNVLYGTADGLQVTAPADQLWTQNSNSVSGKAEKEDAFGSALAAADFNGDGTSDLAVGAPGEDLEPIVDAGATTVLYGTDAGLQAASPNDQLWDQDSAGVAGTSAKSDALGSALAAADFNGDGFADLAMGVPGKTLGSATKAGLVSVLYGTSAGLQAASPDDQKWSQNASGVDDSAETNDAFGAALSAGDLNDDGFADLAVGVPGEGVDGSSGAGAINVLYGGGGRLQTSAPADQFWSEASTSLKGDADPGDGFGSSVAAG